MKGNEYKRKNAENKGELYLLEVCFGGEFVWIKVSDITTYFVNNTTYIFGNL